MEFQPTPFEILENLIKTKLVIFPEEEWETSVWTLVKLQNDFDVRMDEPSLRDVFTNHFEQARKEKEEIIKAKAKELLSFKELMSCNFPKARYVLDPFFEWGTTNMISAPPNNWKSWFVFYIALHIAKGTSVFGKFKTEQSRVMIINEEDSHRSVQDRFKLLGVTDTDLPIYFHIAKGLKIDSIFVKNIIKDLKENNIKVLILDSLRSMHTASENDSTEMQVILDHLKEISRQDITVIFTHHNRKKSPFGKGDDAESTRGSSAINAAISSHISLEEEVRELGPYLIIRHQKSKAGEKEKPFEVKIVKEKGKIDFHYEGNFKDTEKKTLLVKDSILNMLANEQYKTIKEFIKLGVASETIIREAIDQLRKEKLISAISRGEAAAKNILVGSTGKGNELMFSLIEHREHVVDKDLEEFEQSAINNLMK